MAPNYSRELTLAETALVVERRQNRELDDISNEGPCPELHVSQSDPTVCRGIGLSKTLLDRMR